MLFAFGGKGRLEDEIVGAVTEGVTLTLLFTILKVIFKLVIQLSQERSKRIVHVSSVKEIPV